MIGALIAFTVTAQAATASCIYDRETMMALDLQAFDQTASGWRQIADVKGCELAAAELIAAYRRENAAKLAAAQGGQSLIWHEGQLRAGLGQTQEAVDLFREYRSVPAPPVQMAYTNATLAFLERDRAGLLSARDRLKAEPEPPGFSQAAADMKTRNGVTMRWPPNLDVVEGFIACFEKTYALAYTKTCRPSE